MIASKREEIASEAPPSATVPRWYCDGRVSLTMRAFSDAQRQSAYLQGSPDGGSERLRSDFDAAHHQRGS